MKMFFEKELDRYQKHPDFWHPVATEHYLESDSFRGEIDCIDQLNEQVDCLLIEYKRNKNHHDEQELLFYACLLKQIGGFVQKTDYPINIKEIEIYYYETGEIIRRKIQESELDSFEEYMKSIINEIFMPNWIRKENCHILNSTCKFRRVCNCIPDGLLYSGKPQKTEE